MKTTLTLFTILMGFQLGIAQYTVDWSVAPVNPIPKKYTLNHYKLKGDLKKYKFNSIYYEFNNDGKLLFVGDLLGTRDLTYDTQGNLKNIKSSLQYEIDVVLNSKGFVEKLKYNVGGEEKFVYDNKGLYAEKYVSKGKLAEKNYYDNKNRIVKIERFKSSTGDIKSYTEYAYTDYKNLIKVTEKSYYYSTQKEHNYVKYFNDKGDYLGKTSDATIAYDQKDNILYRTTNLGKIDFQYYEYYDGSGNFDEQKPQSPSSTASTQSPNSPGNTQNNTNNSCVGDCQNGWGKKTYNNGYYIGFWVSGKKEGYGMYLWNDAGKYIGEWQDDKMTGYGEYLAKDNKNPKKGYWKNGKLHGLAYVKLGKEWKYGRYENNKLVESYAFTKNGNLITGCLIGDCNNGYGLFKWSNGDSFIGFFKNKNMHLGNYSFSNGNTYYGEFNASNQFHGMGRFFFKNGDYYGGYFKNGNYDGLGFYYHTSTTKKTEKGNWQNGKLVEAY